MSYSVPVHTKQPVLHILSNLGKLGGMVSPFKETSAPHSLLIIPMTFTQEKEQTPPGHTVIISKGKLFFQENRRFTLQTKDF